MRQSIRLILAPPTLKYNKQPIDPEYFRSIRARNYGDIGTRLVDTAPMSGILGAILLPDDRIFCLPNTRSKGAVYDPYRDVYTDTPLMPLCSGSALMEDGRVFCCAYNDLTCVIWNPATNTIQTLPALPSGTQPRGAVRLPDGRILIITYANSCAIYNPATNSFTIAPAVAGSYGGLNMYDGRTFLVNLYPAGSTSKIYNSKTGEITPVSGISLCQSGALMGDGRVLTVPHSLGTFGCVFDPTTLSITNTPNVTGLGGAVLMPDGKRLFCFGRAGSPRIYNPDTNTFDPPITAFAGGGYGCVMRDGRIFLAPRERAAGAIYGSPLPLCLPADRVLNIYDNKS